VHSATILGRLFRFLGTMQEKFCFSPQILRLFDIQCVLPSTVFVQEVFTPTYEAQSASHAQDARMSRNVHYT
jgi:hypothetical protein